MTVSSKPDWAMQRPCFRNKKGDSSLWLHSQISTHISWTRNCQMASPAGRKLTNTLVFVVVLTRHTSTFQSLGSIRKAKGVVEVTQEPRHRCSCCDMHLLCLLTEHISLTINKS